MKQRRVFVTFVFLRTLASMCGEILESSLPLIGVGITAFTLVNHDFSFAERMGLAVGSITIMLGSVNAYRRYIA